MASYLKSLFEQLDTSKEFIELCGPTPDGYTALKREGIPLPTNLKISNVSNPVVINPYGENPQTFNVDFVADVRRIPLGTNSTSLILASYVPMFSDAYLSAPKPFRRFVRKIQAQAAANQGYVGSRINLRKRMLKESARILCNQGLLVLVGVQSQDVQFAQKIGFKVIEVPTATNDYTFVGQYFRKWKG